MKTILFVGASESGKSTLLDALINYVLKVPYADKFRFKMIEDTSDQKAKAKNQVSLAVDNYHIQTVHQLSYESSDIFIYTSYD